MNEKITRRQAIGQMMAAGAAVAVSGSLLESCTSGSKSATHVAQFETSAPEGTKVITRTWEGLGEISLLGLGCMRLPRENGGRLIDQEQVNTMVDYALAHGINYFDTAPAYGQSEEAMGIALSRHPRESYFLATKMSNFAFGPNSIATLEAAKTMFETSLSRLKTDYIDFMLLHSIGSEKDFSGRFADNGVLDYLFSLKEQGIIKHIGFSYHGPDKFLAEMLAKPYKWEFVQIQMNYADWKKIADDSGDDESTKASSSGQYQMLAEKGIPVVIMEPIKGGTLANVNDALKDRLAARYPQLSPAGCALTFAASYPSVMCTLSGMSNMEQLQENIATFTDFKAFGEADNAFMMEMADLYNSNKHVPCTACAYCMPCPNGVNIPGNFKVYNTTSDELNIPDPQNPDKDYKKKKKILLARYKKDLVDGTRADACTKCNVCLEKCPQHIRIPDQLQMIKDLIDSL